ncbi:MAG: hypothetical protein ACI81T_004445, partial [Bacteroidia bacterium]
LFLFSCSSSETYKFYRTDNGLNYPSNKFTIILFEETKGVFINEDVEGKYQEFSFLMSGNLIVIQDVSFIDKEYIFLSKGDTIVSFRNKLRFMYQGKEKSLLSFRREK